jgi:hypothetical protein
MKKIFPALLFISLFIACLGSLSSVLAQSQIQSQSGASPTNQLSVEVRDAGGSILSTGSGANHVTLNHAQPYRQGDSVVVKPPEGQQFIVVRIDPKVPESVLYCPGSKFDFTIPFGKLIEMYDPEAFIGPSHTITARVATPEEISAYRNLALNSLDQRQVSGCFPHAVASSVTRDDPEFFERNIIDGNTQTQGHGKWPYESWGNGLNLDPWIRIDFGRDVNIDKVRLFVRSDTSPDKNHFGRPHDTYWTDATLIFSDGTSRDIALKQSPDAQEFNFPAKKTSSLEIKNFKQPPQPPDQPIGFAAISEIEVYGKESSRAKGRQ